MKISLKIAMILVLGFVIYSCSKENDSFTSEDEGNDFNSPFGSKGDGCDIVTDNPYDYAGQVHNQVIVEYLNQYPEGINDINEMFAITDAPCVENDNFRKHYGTDIISTDPHVVERIVKDYENDYVYIRQMISQKDVSELTKVKLTNLIDFMVAESQQEREPDYEIFDSKLAIFERDIINSTEYSREESELLLSSISIARHSACVWNGQYAGELMKGPGIGFWGWVWVAASDAAGYLGASNPLSGIFQGIKASIKAHKELKAELTANTGSGSGE